MECALHAATWLGLRRSDLVIPHERNAKRFREMAWKTAARMAELANEAEDNNEREYYTRMRNTWITGSAI
jgi:hypothetical protein